MPAFRFFLCLTLGVALWTALLRDSVPALTPWSSLETSCDGNSVGLRWRNRGNYDLFRSTSDWDPAWDKSSSSRLPVTRIRVQGRDSYLDNHVACGVTYTYALRSDRGIVQTVQVAVPPKILTPSKHPQIRVDKRNYCLEIWDGPSLLKRYPIAMGCDPARRKLSFDNASTPEGRYRVIQTQPEATYYKAYDIDYPNPTDQARYQLLQPSTPIGGEIEIHGKGIKANWTFGCVAMRNPDLDELFAHSELGVGTEVWIYGGETSLADLQSDVNSPLPPLEIGKRQKAKGLKVTCLWDVASRGKI